ncbi:Angiogenic factor with G patch and FHA domains 1 [Bagarius yarrelli]|uniref:Angiogenic factor with G patch and FHA domains 1 n=1 Tax=Bagarius yarrelli TaxID=175774 RepID=A0A556TU33_BAGYA|nr:Angiogenic factor with G patch and FHA domains 1 [Bagarius yarrelli]
MERQSEEKSVSLEDKCKSEPDVFQEDGEGSIRFEEMSQKKEDGSNSEPADFQGGCLESEVVAQKMKGCGAEVSELQMEMRSLQQELGKCQIELKRVQKQLDQSLRLQRSTESFNHDLRRQVEELSAELHERKKKEKSRVEAETQTEDYTQFETDYSYYYSGYYQAAAEPSLNTGTEVQENSEVYAVTTETETTSLQQSDGVNNMTDTENSQLYYDANTGIYYYYDDTSGKYQFHSRIELSTVQADQSDQVKINKWKSKRIAEKQEAMAKCLSIIKSQQNHSGVKVRPKAEKDQEELNIEKRGEKKTRRSRSRSRTHRSRSRSRTRHSRSRSRTRRSRSRTRRSRSRSRTRRSRSRSRTRLSRSRSRTRRSRSRSNRSWRSRSGSRTRRSRSRSRTGRSRSQSRTRCSRSPSRTRQSRSRSKTRHSQSRSRLHRSNRAHSEERKKNKKRKKHKKQSHTDQRSNSADINSQSEPEEGEILQSKTKKYPSPSSSSASSSSPPVTSPVTYSPETDMQLMEEGWPPCVRVIVVRSPVLQPGTLFILTADSIATIGREKDMDHAIRIPEMGVSKCHAEVYFDQDQQCYMLVDRGSQNGTVLNGNRILQPKVRCDPCPLTHGDEVKLGETVLSFHIHTGSDTCDACEPGQVLAHLSYRRPEENTGVVLSKEDKELQRQRQLKQIKLKYGLKNSSYDGGCVSSNKYKDRAENRRQTVGSEGTFYRDDAPASVDVRVRAPQSGLGCGTTFSVDQVPTGRSKRQQNWENARERFNHADPDQAKSDSGDVLIE